VLLGVMLRAEDGQLHLAGELVLTGACCHARSAIARIELHERLLSPGLAGSVELDPLKQAFVAAAERTAGEVEGVRDQLTALGWTLDEVADAVASLEREMGVRLDQHTQILDSQLAVLRSIDAALRSPAKVRAAERMGDAAGLLRSRRYDRALQCAREAIDSDPNNPAAFAAAGWALVGVGQFGDAAAEFAEAWVAASDGHRGRVEYARQAGRCYLASGDVARARSLLADAVAEGGDAGGPHSAAGMAPLHYDAALAAAVAADMDAAARAVETAVGLDPRFAQAAVAEPLFDANPELVRRALAVAADVARARQAGERTDTADAVRALARSIAARRFPLPADLPPPLPPEPAPPAFSPKAGGWLRRIVAPRPELNIPPPAPRPPPAPEPIELWEHETSRTGSEWNWTFTGIRLALAPNGDIVFGESFRGTGGFFEQWRDRVATDDELRYPDHKWQHESARFAVQPSVPPFDGITRRLESTDGR
jgi:tetratricopeptide (TPR) repeat protein